MTPIEVSNLWKSYGRGVKRIEAVKGVSFHVESGEIKGLVGASGSGKTTVLQAILGLIKADQGSVGLIRPVGYVAQDPFSALPPYYTVAQCVAEPLIFLNGRMSRQEINDRVDLVLNQVHLEPAQFKTKIPSQLSGGERQRVLLARALAPEPKVIILDEPTSMIDETIKGDIIKLIKELAGRLRPAVLLVTHDLKAAATIWDHLIVMKEGRLVERGTSDEIIARSQNDYTKALVKAAFNLPAYWKERAGDREEL